MKLLIKVVPGASRSHVAGWLGDVLKIRVSAPPEKGKANKAVEKTIADALDIPRNHVQILSGHATPRKIIEIEGLTEGKLLQQIPRQ